MATRRAALGLAIALTSAGLLTGGWQASTGVGSWPPPARTPAANPASATPATAAGGVCSTTGSGNVTNCPRPVPRAQLPAKAKDGSRMSTLPADLATLVDTRTWTSGGGNTFPGAEYPFGMVQWSPDTMPNRTDGGGYTYGDRKLTGYSLTHVSGPGCLAAGDIPILPMTGALPAGDPSTITTPFTNSGEVAQAGYYVARNNMPQTITSRFSATAHAAIGHFIFPKTKRADFLIKLRDSQKPDTASHVVLTGNDEVSGSETTGGFCNETSKNGPQDYTIYFDIVFSEPFTSSKVITEKGQADPDAAFLTFNTSADNSILAKVGISYVSARNAALNWQTDSPGWSLTPVQAAAQASWNSLLSEIKVTGGTTAETQLFYSLLYKDFLQPNIVSDVNGQFLGSDQKVQTVAAGQASQYSMFSGWDIYHSLSQLQAMLDPTAASDMAQSLVNYYSENGILPQWGYLNLDNYAQVGDPSDAIIADIYAFGGTNFQTRTALEQMVHQAETTNRVRPGTRLQAKYGFLPVDASYGCCDLKALVSALLEYDTADFATSQFATALDDSTDAATLRNLANSWATLFDKKTGLLTGRNRDGSFLQGVTASTTRNYLEGNAGQYLWDVPNNYQGLFAKLGGDAEVGPRLRHYLSKPNGRGQFAYLADEFDLGEQFAPDYADYPSDTQYVVNTMRRTLYKPGPDGITNNDDLGAESSQYIWEMLGMYPENPGSGNLVFASPGFPKAVITLPTGPVITINAPGASRSKFYVSKLTLNGTADNNLYVPFSPLTSGTGATLDWTLTKAPTAWGSERPDAPPSYGNVKS